MLSPYKIRKSLLSTLVKLIVNAHNCKFTTGQFLNLEIIGRRFVPLDM